MAEGSVVRLKIVGRAPRGVLTSARLMVAGKGAAGEMASAINSLGERVDYVLLIAAWFRGRNPRRVV